MRNSLNSTWFTSSTDFSMTAWQHVLSLYVRYFKYDLTFQFHKKICFSSVLVSIIFFVRWDYLTHSFWKKSKHDISQHYSDILDYSMILEIAYCYPKFLTFKCLGLLNISHSLYNTTFLTFKIWLNTLKGNYVTTSQKKLFNGSWL